MSALSAALDAAQDSANAIGLNGKASELPEEPRDIAAGQSGPEIVDVVDMSHVSSLLSPIVQQYLLQCLDATMSSLHVEGNEGSPNFRFKLGTDSTLPWSDADHSVATGEILMQTGSQHTDLNVLRDPVTTEWCIEVQGSDSTYALLGGGESKLHQVLIVGDPGMGKTAILTQLAHGITNAALREPEKALSLIHISEPTRPRLI
eukprot:3127166-Rhodomonas_salina.1